MIARVVRVVVSAIGVLSIFVAVPSARGARQSTPPRSAFALAIDQLESGRAAVAVLAFEKATTDPYLGGYARVYAGRAYLALNQPARATSLAGEVLTSGANGYLRESALWLAADSAEAARDWPAAMRALEALVEASLLNPEKAHLRLGRAAAAGGDRALALQALTKVYYDFPLTLEADDAADDLKKLLAPAPLSSVGSMMREFQRAEILFGAKRYLEARTAFMPISNGPASDQRNIADLRVAECNVFLKKYQAARDGLRVHRDTAGPLQAEAQFYDLNALRETGLRDEYVARTRTFVDEHPQSLLAEDALNTLATFYVLQDDDTKAANVMVDLLQKFPNGPHADRAAWRVGWQAYKVGRYADAVKTFEWAAVSFRRADYRPSWLYWAARAHIRLNERSAAIAGYRQVIADYCNSYYGREASRELATLLAPQAADLNPPAPASRALPAPPAIGALPAGAAIVRRLLDAGLFDDAILELKTLQHATGTSQAIEVTLAYALNGKGELRPAITAMRRAVPQFMAEGGEKLSPDVLAVIFPLVYWDLIRAQATVKGLDPYLVAALVAQESTFDADVRSAANAYGLMQIVPATGRQYAKSLGIRPFSTFRLTDPETNVRIGTAFFSDLLKRFGSVAPALAAYNAGESRVSRWLSERPGVDRAEFIDDIPYPETQNYVKRILGTAEDYRRLYKDSAAPKGSR